MMGIGGFFLAAAFCAFVWVIASLVDWNFSISGWSVRLCLVMSVMAGFLLAVILD
jgi:hypothetical protein